MMRHGLSMGILKRTARTAQRTHSRCFTHPATPVAARVDTPAPLSDIGHDLSPITRNDRLAMERRLPPVQHESLIRKSTEAPHSGTTSNGLSFSTRRSGIYVCALGGLPVFHSQQKASSMVQLMGYATFTRPICKEHLIENPVMVGMPQKPGMKELLQIAIDDKPCNQCPMANWGFVHYELVDARAGAHLGWSFIHEGHVWYSVNSASLHFVPDGEDIPTTCWDPLQTSSEEALNRDSIRESASNCDDCSNKEKCVFKSMLGELKEFPR